MRQERASPSARRAAVVGWRRSRTLSAASADVPIRAGASHITEGTGLSPGTLSTTKAALESGSPAPTAREAS
jgi:hypothetical protein